MSVPGRRFEGLVSLCNQILVGPMRWLNRMIEFGAAAVVEKIVRAPSSSLVLSLLREVYLPRGGSVGSGGCCDGGRCGVS